MFLKRNTARVLPRLVRQLSSNGWYVPTLDLSQFTHGNPTDRCQFVEDLRSACHEGVGFFYLSGHPIPEREITEVENLVEAIFSLPPEQKAKIDMRGSPHFRGWEGPGRELTGGKPDIREQIDMWTEHDVVPVNGSTPKYMSLLGPNQYFEDDTMPGCRAISRNWHDRCCEISVELLKAFSLALGMDENALDNRFGEKSRRTSMFKFIHYPGHADDQGVGLHQDTGFLTLLMPGKVSGLEAQLPDGTFLPVGRKEGAFVVNIGEAMQLMTGNYFVATPHQVLATEKRFSTAFFYGPTIDSVLTPPLDIPKSYQEKVRNSPRHNSAGTMPSKEELELGILGTFQGKHRHETYGDMLWNYVSRAHPDVLELHYGSGTD